MAKLLWYAFRFPCSLILVTAPKYDQAKNVAFKALHEHLERMRGVDRRFFDYVVGRRNVLKTVIRFRNGSVIQVESPVPETIRVHTAKVVYLMEANFIRDDLDLYTAVLFSLNTTNGYLIAESTPWNRDSVFYSMFHDAAFDQFSTHRVVYTEALPPNGPRAHRCEHDPEARHQGDEDDQSPGQLNSNADSQPHRQHLPHLLHQHTGTHGDCDRKGHQQRNPSIPLGHTGAGKHTEERTLPKPRQDILLLRHDGRSKKDAHSTRDTHRTEAKRTSNPL
jgi:hypothetical protein